jgi:hypothetical protein
MTEPPPTAPSLRLSQHPNEHRSKSPVLLAVDQELGGGATLRVAPELSDPVGSLEVWEAEDVEEFGAGTGAEGLEALTESALKLVGSHGRRLTLSLGRRGEWLCRERRTMGSSSTWIRLRGFPSKRLGAADTLTTSTP